MSLLPFVGVVGRAERGNLTYCPACDRAPQPPTSYRRPPPLALCRTRTDWKHEFVAVCGCGWSGRTGKSHILPSVRSRTTAAHDSQPWGICKQSVTGNQPRPALKKRRGSLAIRRGLKQMQQGRGVSLERVRGSCRKRSR